MGRLIDADALIEWINEQREQVTKKQVAGTDGSIFTRESLVVMQRCICTFETKINNMPTAYDSEKVKKEIDRVGKSFCDYVACNEECTSCEHHSIMNAVTCIVRKGGV